MNTMGCPSTGPSIALSGVAKGGQARAYAQAFLLDAQVSQP